MQPPNACFELLRARAEASCIQRYKEQKHTPASVFFLQTAHVRHLASRRQSLEFMQVDGKSCVPLIRAASGMPNNLQRA